MRIEKLETPAGLFRVLVNGIAVEFEVREGTYNTYYLNDDTPAHPLGCYDITIDISDFAIDDVIICEYEKGKLIPDGGGENMLNIVGEVEGYTVGMGADDTDDLERAYAFAQNSNQGEISNTKRYMPYSNRGNTRRGFEFQIIDNPKLYKVYLNRRIIRILLVWESNTKDYAWDIVSFLTS